MMMTRPATSEPVFKMNDAEFFFQSPPDRLVADSNGQSKHSTLTALRGDVDFCMGIDRSKGKTSLPAQRTALWSGAIAIMAGIDLLAKFYAGCDDTGKVGERFKTFVEKFFGLATEDANILYRLRNSLVHSYGLSFEVDGSHIDLASDLNQGLLVSSNTNRKVVDLLALYHQFEKAISEYFDTIKSDATLQTHFARIFATYGSFFTYIPRPPTTAPLPMPVLGPPSREAPLPSSISTGQPW
jgi:hypothetical protein